MTRSVVRGRTASLEWGSFGTSARAGHSRSLARALVLPARSLAAKHPEKRLRRKTPRRKHQCSRRSPRLERPSRAPAADLGPANISMRPLLQSTPPKTEPTQTTVGNTCGAHARARGGQSRDFPTGGDGVRDGARNIRRDSAPSVSGQSYEPRATARPRATPESRGGDIATSLPFSRPSSPWRWPAVVARAWRATGRNAREQQARLLRDLLRISPGPGAVKLWPGSGKLARFGQIGPGPTRNFARPKVDHGPIFMWLGSTKGRPASAQRERRYTLLAPRLDRGSTEFGPGATQLWARATKPWAGSPGDWPETTKIGAALSQQHRVPDIGTEFSRIARHRPDLAEAACM